MVELSTVELPKQIMLAKDFPRAALSLHFIEWKWRERRKGLGRLLLLDLSKKTTIPIK